MKLINCDLRTFISTFGIEGVRLVENYNVDVYLVNNDVAAALNIPGVAGLTAGNWMAKPGESAAIMFFNVDLISAGINPLKRNVKGSAEQHFCSVLVHELTHVDQILDGRMGFKDGKMTWEGKKVDVSNNGSDDYISQPWELEAHAAQIRYMYPGDEARVNRFLNKYNKAA